MITSRSIIIWISTENLWLTRRTRGDGPAKECIHASQCYSSKYRQSGFHVWYWCYSLDTIASKYFFRRWFTGLQTSHADPKLFFPIFCNHQNNVYFELAWCDFGDYYLHDGNCYTKDLRSWQSDLSIYEEKKRDFSRDAQELSRSAGIRRKTS